MNIIRYSSTVFNNDFNDIHSAMTLKPVKLPELKVFILVYNSRGTILTLLKYFVAWITRA